MTLILLCLFVQSKPESPRVDLVAPSKFHMQVSTYDGIKLTRYGCGSLCEYNNCITALHVVKGGTRIFAQFDKDGLHYKCKVMQELPEYDLCVLRIENADLEGCRLGRVCGPHIYWENGVNKKAQAYHVLVNQLESTPSTVMMAFRDGVTCQPGNSGRGIYNEKEELVGVITHSNREHQIVYAFPAYTLSELKLQRRKLP